ncbi:hypothetical protein Tco_0011993 [Tanacetum coccineum]
MRTRSQSRNSNYQQQQVNPTFVEPFNLVEPIENQAHPIVTMADNRTMAQLLKAPTVGYEDAIVVPEITADNFELKHGLLTLVQNKQRFRHDKEDPHAHICNHLRSHKKVSKEIMEEVVSTWLIRSYRKQFEEYMEIKRRLEIRGINTDVECNPSNEEFQMKEMFWGIHKLTENLKIEIEDIRRLNTTPRYYKSISKEFNYLLEIHIDVLTKDIPGFKTYEDYKNAWIYEWTKELDTLIGYLYLKEDGYCNGGNLLGMIQVGNMTYFQNYKWYEALEDSDLKDVALKKSYLGWIMGT